jgi:hypothetical protein
VDSPRQVNLLGRLEIDYAHNVVSFHPGESDEAFSLPLSPLDIDIARSLCKYGKTKQAKEQSGRDETAVGKAAH